MVFMHYVLISQYNIYTQLHTLISFVLSVVVEAWPRREALVVYHMQAKCCC